MRAALLWILIVICAGASSAFGQTSDPRRAQLIAYVRAATDCIAARVASYGGSKATAPSELDAMIGRVFDEYACQPQLSAVAREHDRLSGPGSGQRFLSGPYMNDLPRAVMARLPERSFVSPPSAPPTLDRPAPSRPQIATTPTRPATISARGSDKELSPEDKAMIAKFVTVMVASGACFFVLLLAGLGSRIVVYADPGDVILTALIFFAPIGGLLALLGVGWVTLQSGDGLAGKTWIEAAKAYPACAIVIGLTAIVWLTAVWHTLASSIRHNGFVVGILVASLKVGSGVFAMLTCLGAFYLNADNPNARQRSLVALVLLGFFIWIASLLINGERVYARREAIAYQA